MRIAFIGASHWHLPLYLDPALALPGVEVVGMSDPDPSVLQDLEQRLGCAIDRDYRALCRRVKPDFVFALGRHADMPDEARFLIDEGIPFAIEKPCGLNEADVAAIARHAAAKGTFAAVPLVFRQGDFLAMLQEETARGGAQYMTYRFIAGFPARYIQARCAWMLDPTLSGGGCTINLAPHFFDIALMLMGADVEVHQCVMSNEAWGYPIEDYSAVTFRRGGQICVAETGYLYPGPTSTFDMHYAIRTPQRYIIADDPDTTRLIDPDGTMTTGRWGTTNVPNYPLFVADVLDRAATGRPPLASLDDMVPIMRLMDRAYALAGALPR